MTEPRVFTYAEIDRVVTGEAFDTALAAELDKTGARRAFLLVGGTLSRETDTVDRIQAQLGDRLVGVCNRMSSHTPLDEVIAAAKDARAADADVVVTLGGGSVTDGFAPSLSLVSARELPGGSLDAGTYVYKMTFVDEDGFESLASADDFTFTVTDNNRSVELTALPLITRGNDYVSRRLYRAVDSANPEFRLVADLDASSASFIDDLALDAGSPGLVTLDLNRAGTRGRLDGSLVMDPGLVMKMTGARIELQPGSQVLAEGDGSAPVVMTSLRDDRFGAGGTFDTNNDDDSPIFQAPSQGDWAGIYAGPTSNISIDHGVVAYAGGISLIEGGETIGFVPLHLQQSEGRITNTRFEFNDSG
ncbi:MAG: iron-containing alcohol dehydrogenase, partial [Pseudomonadota bacterium]